MADSLKSKTFSGLVWSAAERFSVQGITFIIQIILARLLAPSDYGIIGLLAIFLQVAQVFIDCGFAQALIQKQDCTERDYSTVFYYNLAISIGLYLLFFAIAPLVAKFYSLPLLCPVMRVLSLNFVINALSIVQKTKLVKRIDFKLQLKITLISVVLSGVIGIILAYKEWGVWALVAQTLLNGTFQVVGYYYYTRWLPLICFDKDSFRKLFGYGSKLLVSNIINVIYKNLYTLVIGKRYSSVEVGYYTRADQFALFPSSNLTGIFTRVIFPILSKLQEDEVRLKNAYRKSIRYSSFVIFPLMFGLISLSKPFVLFFLTEKWAGVIILLQILCIDWMLDHISALNLNLLLVKGRTDLALKLEFVKKSIAILILVISVPFGLVVMCWGRVLYSVIATYLNTIYTKKLVGLSFGQQMKDIYPYLLVASIMGIVVYFTIGFISITWIQLLTGLIVGVIVYVALSLLFFKDTINDIIPLVTKKVSQQY